MKLRIRQRVFSWTDSYDIYNEWDEPVYEVRAALFSLGHQIHVYDKRTGREVGAIHQKLLKLLPQFAIVLEGREQGSIRKELSFLRERYRVDYRGWDVEGDLLEWNYRVTAGRREVMTISKELFRFTDTYVLECENAADALPGLLLVLAIDAANCKED